MNNFIIGTATTPNEAVELQKANVDLVVASGFEAGGIADARGIAAAFALGAEGAQIGTAFLACQESGASPMHREALLSGKAERTALTRGFTGRLARGIKNRLLDTLNAAGSEVLPYPLQRSLVRNLTMAAELSGLPELVPMWAGQSAGLSHYTTAAELLDSLVSGVSARID